MVNRFLSLFLLSLSTIMPQSMVADNEALYNRLDSLIAVSKKYVDIRLQRIDALRHKLASANDLEARYQLAFRLYEEYMPYQSDSAMTYIGQCVDIAGSMGDATRLCKDKALMAYLCSSTGQYVEALDILGDIDTTNVGPNALSQYFISLVYLYGELGYYGNVPSRKKLFFEKQQDYMREMYRVTPTDNDYYLQRKEMDCYNRKAYREALEINDVRMSKVQEYSHQYAIVAYYRHMHLKMLGNEEDAMEWLAKSAISDVLNAVMDQGSLWELANMLYGRGQMSRARNYISFAWECANVYSTHMRSLQISPVLSTIDKQYQEDMEETNSALSVMTIAISVLVVVLLMVLFHEYKQRRRLREAHSTLSLRNDDMRRLNEELRMANQALDDTNRQLQAIVSQLNEQTRVKDVYVGRFMSLCSDYIDKIDDFRKRVNRMVKGHEYEELYRLTKSTDMKTMEIENLYAAFDNAFLHLFPNFISDFNALLLPDERIVVQGEYKLNTTLRIFALIRLGIDDSSRIAKFLHYSVNTIYNYRARIKGVAITHRDDFETRVKNIGM